MEYSAVHNKLMVSPKEMQAFCNELKYVMADIRKSLGVQLTPRKKEDTSEKIDQIEWGVIRACKSIGIDLGAERGYQLDLSQFAN